KPVASNRDLLALVDDIDVVPALARAGDGVKRFLVVVLEVRKSLVRKDDSPTERVIWCVAFEDRHLGRTIELLHQDCEIQSRWPSSDYGYFHYSLVMGDLRRRLSSPAPFVPRIDGYGVPPKNPTEVLSRMHSLLRQSHL